MTREEVAREWAAMHAKGPRIKCSRAYKAGLTTPPLETAFPDGRWYFTVK